MIGNSTLCRVMFAVIFLSACSGDDTSTNATEPLLPLWIIDNDQNTGSVQVSGRVTRRINDNEFIRDEFDLLTFAQDIAKFIVDDEDSGVPISDSGIRLVDRDRMRVVAENGIFQLLRREMLFNYRTRFAIGQTLADLELRLDYSRRRFAPSVTTSQYVNVTDFVVAEDSIPLTLSEGINLAWNVSDLMIADADQLIQRVFVSLEQCDTASISSNDLVLSVPADARAIRIDISNFPVPALSNPVPGNDSEVIGTCGYNVQIIAAVVPDFLIDENNLAIGEQVDPQSDAIVVSVGRSLTRQVQVDYGN